MRALTTTADHHEDGTAGTSTEAPPNHPDTASGKLAYIHMSWCLRYFPHVPHIHKHVFAQALDAIITVSNTVDVVAALQSVRAIFRSPFQ
jgi:hypothetical protein